MDQFKALRVHQGEQGPVARMDRIGIDDLSAGDVVVRVAYSCINYKDALAVSGKGRIMRAFPRTAGIDFSGTVERSDAAAFRKGDKVVVTGCNVGEIYDGGFAEFARVPASTLVPLPEGLSLFEAMALGTAGFTAGLALRRMLENHQAPELGPIAVTGPTGGVGAIVIQLLKRQGFTVAAITGKPVQAERFLRELGVDEIVDRNTLDLGRKPLESARWGGAVDNLGGDTLGYLTRTVRPWGNIACVGLAQSPALNSTVMPLILRGVSLLGIWSVEPPQAWRLDIWRHLASDWKPTALDTLIAPRLVDLDEVPELCDAQIAGSLTGRTVVRLAGG
jgi:NADPH2:quinone reductase